MKKWLLLSLLIAACFSNANSQVCIPNNDTITGIEPDTLDVTYVNVPYNQVIYFHLPADTNVNIIIGQDTVPVHVCIDSLTIDSVHGLPDGFSFACNVPWCSVLGNGNGCAAISGTASASQVGIYPLNVFVTVYTNDCFGFSLPPQIDTVTFYYLDIEFATGQQEISSSNIISFGECYPNPSSIQTTIPFYLSDENEVETSILSLEGKTIFDKNVQAKRGFNTEPLDVSSFPEGTYFVALKCDGQKIFTKLEVTR